MSSSIAAPLGRSPHPNTRTERWIEVQGGLEVGSVEEVPPLLGEGHLVDAVALFGRDLVPADGIGPDELESWFCDRPAPKPGSVVLLRTGWMRYGTTATVTSGSRRGSRA
ncbi:MAG TPA: hypothetical protein VNT55_18085 [Baekduia sp.]|nr:hypothetical protein [Baekduia sp.]